MRAASTRYGKRKAHVAGIIALAGVFLYHGMCSLNDSSRTAGGKARRKSAAPPAAAAAAIADSSLSCDWEEGGPELFVIRHNTNHPVASHWFHIAECFTGLRASLKKTIGGVGGTVYLQVLDPAWMAKLSPMSRLLIASALTSAGTSDVHFVDADRASFSYSSASEGASGRTSDAKKRQEVPAPASASASPPSGRVESNVHAPATKFAHDTDEIEDAASGGSHRSGPHRRLQQQQQQEPPRQRRLKREGAKAKSVAADEQPPRAGQVGLLEFDPRGHGSEFVVSLGSALPERLTVTADVAALAENQDGEEGARGDGLRGGAVRGGEGGGGRGTRYSGPGDSTTREPVCVKYLMTVGQKTVNRKDWFPDPEDARSLQAAIDTYCPVPFLRGGSGGGVGEGGDVEGGGEEEGGAGGTRRLLLYQRDQNRQIRHADTVLEDLRERLGDGWVVEKMMHDSDRHPCELVETLGNVDVLLTAHGFQSMLGLFMRPGSLLFEVFPHKYFKAGYAPMAEGLGVRHAFSMSRSLRPLIGFSHPSTETCMNWYVCRWYSRGSDVEIDEDSLQRLVRLALEPAS